MIPADRLDVPCRVYAPVGSHEDLLPYLVRRLLENGANSSFVNRISDEDVSIDDLVRDPVEVVAGFEAIAHPRIPLPVDLYRGFTASTGQDDRSNSMGVNLANDDRLRTLEQQVNATDLPEDVKVKLQSYITGCYGSLTSFNVLFADEDDQFKGSGGD